jgi:hypothetical protein
MQSDTASLTKLHILEALFQKGYKSDLVGNALNKLVELELDLADNIEWISFLDMRTVLFQRIRLLQEESA